MGNDLSSHGSSLPTSPTATQTMEAVTGLHQLHITRYSSTRGLGIGKHISSTSFSIGGCSWTIQFYPDGASEADEQYISLGLTLCGGPWITHAHFDFTLVDWHAIPWKDAESKPLSRDFWRGDVHIVKFMERELFEASDYLNDDAFIIRCTMTVMKFPHVSGSKIARSISIPKCELRKQLGHLLTSGLGADVTFEVGEVHSSCQLASVQGSSLRSYEGKRHELDQDQANRSTCFQGNAQFHLYRYDF
jgi:speckle-type POZ protein